MTAYDIRTGVTDLNFQAKSFEMQILSRTIDFAKFTGSAAGAAADTADVIDIPAGFVVESVFVQNVTPSTTTSSVFGVGDTSSSVGYFPNTTSATAAATTIVSGTGAYLLTSFATTPAVNNVVTNIGKAYATADRIRVVLGATAPLNGKVKIWVRGWVLV